MKCQPLGFLGRRQRGQTLILFTLLFTVLVGFLALAIDLGFLFGQRRLDQDGADASAMAMASSVASNVVALSDGSLYISSTDCDLYILARQYGGLSDTTCGSTLSSTPSGVNQNSALDSGNKLAVVVEYCNGSTSCDPGTAADWCFSRASINGLPTGTLTGGQMPRSGESECTNYNSVYPPQPGSNPYKVRVTVSTVTPSAFAQMLVPNGNLGPDPTNNSASGPACVRPGGANGMLACSQAIATIAGVENQNSGAVLLPFVANDCNIGSNAPGLGQLTQLWTNNPPPNCTGQSTTGSWKSVVDFSLETAWCPNYNYEVALPDTVVDSQPYSSYSGSMTYPCSTPPPNQTGSEHDWHRLGYQPDASYNGADNPINDIQYWASQGFGGTIIADYTNGNFVPTYCDQTSGAGCGNHGNNIAQAFYCQSGDVTNSGDGCSIAGNNQVTYFFQRSKIVTGSACQLPDGSTPGSSVWCREAGIPTWKNPKTWQDNGNGNYQWKNNGTPDRVQIVRWLQMRLYCQKPAGSQDCTDPPSTVTGSSSSSEVWGFFVSDRVNLCPPAPASCTSGLSIQVNVPTLSG